MAVRQPSAEDKHNFVPWLALEIEQVLNHRQQLHIIEICVDFLAELTPQRLLRPLTEFNATTRRPTIMLASV